jgi:hypothetical protein
MRNIAGGIVAREETLQGPIRLPVSDFMSKLTDAVAGR